jgi:hypothetical protein
MFDLMLHAPSEEQQRIITATAANNVIVDSVAGSGKTTTILHIAHSYQPERILVLTYNRRLRLETRAKADELGLVFTIHTYHSFAVNHIGRDCCTDAGIIRFIDSGGALTCLQYDIIIIDETQDMNDIYYKLACKIAALSPDARLVVIGDKFQSIYRFADADYRFITLADRLYITARPWTRLTLTTSYRITRQVAAFVNCILGANRLHAVKDGPMPRYVIYDGCFDYHMVVDEVKSLLTQGYRADDIFILAPTVRPKAERTRADGSFIRNPLARVANALCNPSNKLLVYVPSNDDQQLDEDIIRHKIVFSSFHQSKGLERKHVIIIGFDDSYAKYYNRDDPTNNTQCSNAMYVALTRSSCSMTLYHNHQRASLEYAPLTGPRSIVPFVELCEFKKIAAVGVGDRPQSFSATKLCQHLSSKVLMRCMEYIKYTVIRKGKTIDIPCKTEQQTPPDPFGDILTYHEDVSAINGLAVTMFCEWIYTDRATSWPDVGGAEEAETIQFPYVQGNFRAEYPPTAAQMLWLANRSISRRDGLAFKMKQIRRYTWLTEAKFSQLIDRMESEIHSHAPLFEVPLRSKFLGFEVFGAVDIVVGDRLYEIKTVGDLSPEHFVQLAIYMFLMRSSGAEVYYGVQHNLLYNARADELVEINMSMESLEQLMKLLLCNKAHAKSEVDDDEFLRKLNVGGPSVAACPTDKSEGHGPRVAGRCIRCDELGW